MGVWIEIKHLSELMNAVEVTPFVGVWIEIDIFPLFTQHSLVTPFVGVWIEISHMVHMCLVLTSLPSWECGLKSWKNVQSI